MRHIITRTAEAKWFKMEHNNVQTCLYNNINVTYILYCRRQNRFFRAVNITIVCSYAWAFPGWGGGKTRSLGPLPPIILNLFSQTLTVKNASIKCIGQS